VDRTTATVPTVSWSLIGTPTQSGAPGSCGDFFGSAQEAAAERYEPDLVALRRRVQDRFLSELGTLDTPQWQSGAGAT
jgi:hypothetical protein